MGNVALVDSAVDRVSSVCARVAVNVHAGRGRMEEHFQAGAAGEGRVDLGDRTGLGGTDGRTAVQLSFEAPRPLGTAGALGQLRWWLDGEAVLVVNGDTWTTAGLEAFLAAWDGERVAVLLHEPDLAGTGRAPSFTPTSRLAATLLPWTEVRTLAAEPSGLYAECLAPAAAAGRLATVAAGGAFHDCGTPASYLAANLAAAGEGNIVDGEAEIEGSIDRSVIGAATVAGTVRRSVVWSGATVFESEDLHDAIRTDDGTTVLLR